ncbi:hypothetical protein DXU02_34935 [Rhizobium leguminosarum]
MREVDAGDDRSRTQGLLPEGSKVLYAISAAPRRSTAIAITTRTGDWHRQVNRPGIALNIAEWQAEPIMITPPQFDLQSIRQ